VHTESQDSERTVSGVVVGERVAPDDHAAAKSPTPEMMVTVAVGSSKEVAGASATAALVVVSSVQPTSSATGRAPSGLRLEEDVVLQFDATHRLTKLTES
jgi:thiamine monophosphate synthase